jgi:hypothetical protein
MSLVRSRKFQLGLMFATALSVSIWSGAGHAYTQDEQAACTDDAFRLCGADIPDVDRVTVCMVRRKAELSPGCRVYFRSGPEPDPAVTPVAAGRPLSIKPATPKKPVSAKARKAKKPKRGET